MGKIKAKAPTTDKPAENADQAIDAEKIDTSHIAGDLTTALVDRIRGMQKPWQQMSEEEQTNLIWGLRDAVNSMVRGVVQTIAADGRNVIVAELEKVEVKESMKCVLTMSKRDENRLELIDATGSTVLVVLAGATEYLGGDNPVADKDQNKLPLDDDKPVADSTRALAAE